MLVPFCWDGGREFERPEGWGGGGKWRDLEPFPRSFMAITGDGRNRGFRTRKQDGMI